MKDYYGYNGKICVVTGAASGMGKATTEMLVDLGAQVYALDVTEVQTPGIVKFLKTNVGDKASIDATFKELPDKIDKFFGIAGVSGVKTDYNTTFTINFIGNKYITDTYLKDRMPEGGAIAYITSAGGLSWEPEDHRAELKTMVEADGWDAMVQILQSWNMNAQPGMMGYMSSKRAGNYYAALMAVEMGKAKKIRVNCVLPGQTQTGLTAEFTAAKQGHGDILDANGFARRFAAPEEMGGPIVFLNSDLASFISGVMIDVDYGNRVVIKAGLAPDNMNFKFFSR